MALNVLFLPFLHQEIMRFLLMCAAMVLLSASVHLQKANIKTRYKKFERQHINKNMSVNACDDVMQTRNISRLRNNKCKKINTFVRADINTVKSICNGKGVPHGDKTKSNQRFNLVVCELKKQSTKPLRCHYKGHEKLSKRIIIKCEKGYPVHYGGDIKHCDN